jgi:phage-related protein
VLVKRAAQSWRAIGLTGFDIGDRADLCSEGIASYIMETHNPFGLVMTEKPVYWFGTSKDDLCDFPNEARREAGFALWKVQQGPKFEEAIYILHVFQKKTQKTSQQDIQVGQRRYKELTQQRQNQES